jgi:hypothetical protein
MRRLLLITVLAALAPFVSAQRFGGGPRFSSGFPRFGGYSRPSLYPFGAYPLGFADPLYADYLSGVGYPVASAPPIVLVQQQAAPAGDPNPHLVAPAQPLMIELRGGRYVRINGDDTSGAETLDVAPSLPIRGNDATDSARSSAAPREIPPAILVFRDGHQEEVSEYTISGGMLYTHGNYYADGSWTRSIDLSVLNLSETLASNQSRGVSFRLPAAPNEVIIRP